MSYIEEKILARLEPVKEEPTKQIMVQFSSSSVDTIKQLAKTMSQATGKRITQTMLFNDAVEALIEECMADPELKQFFDACQGEELTAAPSGPEEDMPQGPVMSL